MKTKKTTPAITKADTKATEAPAKPTRIRRNTSQLISALQERITELAAKEEAREAELAARHSPEGEAILGAVRGIDRAWRTAKEIGKKELVGTLESARSVLEAHAAEIDIRLPDPSVKIGRPRKS